MIFIFLIQKSKLSYLLSPLFFLSFGSPSLSHYLYSFSLTSRNLFCHPLPMTSIFSISPPVFLTSFFSNPWISSFFSFYFFFLLFPIPCLVRRWKLSAMQLSGKICSLWTTTESPSEFCLLTTPKHKRYFERSGLMVSAFAFGSDGARFNTKWGYCRHLHIYRARITGTSYPLHHSLALRGQQLSNSVPMVLGGGVDTAVQIRRVYK